MIQLSIMSMEINNIQSQKQIIPNSKNKTKKKDAFTIKSKASFIILL